MKHDEEKLDLIVSSKGLIVDGVLGAEFTEDEIVDIAKAYAEHQNAALIERVAALESKIDSVRGHIALCERASVVRNEEVSSTILIKFVREMLADKEAD